MVDTAKAKYVPQRKATYWKNEKKANQTDPDFQGVSYSVGTLNTYSKMVDGRKVVDYEAIPESEKQYVSLWQNHDSNGKVVLKTTESKKEGGESSPSGDDLPF
tara:strand:+ start:464 stop:772 length:309 start_codon:yes stop_codon:yes gene_type:complete